MPRLHVCSLRLIEAEVARTGARSLVTLLSPGTPVTRPLDIAEARHLNIAMSDIVQPLEGQVMPGAEHIDAFLGFVEGWDRREPMLIHCLRGRVALHGERLYRGLQALAAPRRAGDRFGSARRLAHRDAQPALRRARRRAAGSRGPHGCGHRGDRARARVHGGRAVRAGTLKVTPVAAAVPPPSPCAQAV